MTDNIMSLLVLGGASAMGTDLVKILAAKGCSVTVTSRSEHRNESNITYLKGSAKDNVFLMEVLRNHWACIVDFMSYTTEEFRNRVGVLLAATDQYVFISSDG